MLSATRQVQAQPLGRAWLRDRGGVPLDPIPGKEEDFLHPEELSSVGVVPCRPSPTSNTFKGAGGECVVVGTTARRVVQMSVRELDGNKSTWVPQRLLQS